MNKTRFGIWLVVLIGLLWITHSASYNFTLKGNVIEINIWPNHWWQWLVGDIPSWQKYGLGIQRELWNSLMVSLSIFIGSLLGIMVLSIVLIQNKIIYKLASIVVFPAFIVGLGVWFLAVRYMPILLGFPYNFLVVSFLLSIRPAVWLARNVLHEQPMKQISYNWASLYLVDQMQWTILDRHSRWTYWFITVMWFEIPRIWFGTVILEKLFYVSGAGQLWFDALIHNDRPLMIWFLGFSILLGLITIPQAKKWQRKMG